MSEEKEHFTYMVAEEKNTFRQIRNTRYMGLPYPQSSSRLDASNGNNSSVAAATVANNQLAAASFIPQIKTQPDSPLVTSLDQTSENTKANDLIKLPENLENLPKADEFPAKRNRWNTNEEILALLLNFPKHDEWQSKDVVIRPESGSMLMYSRKKVRYRRDGYCWKKRKDGKTTREDHMKLKVQGVECIYGCYVHSAVLPTFHRRCYWLLQNPDIVLVHYLNVPYPDDSKLAALIPNIAFWTEKKEWTREELLLQLKPMYETPTLENGGSNGAKENETEEAKLNRINISSFIESMIAQLLEKQRYVRTALSNSVECGCGNRKCLGSTRCTRPIRRIIPSAKKPMKRAASTMVKLPPDKRSSNCNGVALNSVREKAVVSLVPIGRGQEENWKAKNLTMKSLSSYLNIDLVHVESALSLRQYCDVNVRRLHVQSALRALNDQMTVDFEERSKHKLQSSKFNREEVEPIIRAQVKDALAIQNPIDRENTVVNLILVEAQKFSIANQQVGTLSEQKRNILKTTPLRKLSGVSANSRLHGGGIHSTNSAPAYYGSALSMSGSNVDTERSNQSQVQQNSPQLQQLLQAPAQSDVRQQMSQTHEPMQSKLHQQMTMQTSNSKEFSSSYSHSDGYLPVSDFVNSESRHYQPNYAGCPMVDAYVPNNEMEITDVDKQEPSNVNENVSTLMPYNVEESEYIVDKYQSDTTDGSDSTSYTTTHHQASPSNSFTSAEGAETYANGDLLDDLIMNVNPCYNYENGDYANTDHSLYELIIQLTQKEKKTTCSNSVVTCEKLQQYSMQNESSESYAPMFENEAPAFGSDTNGNFLNSYSRYATSATNGDDHVTQAHASTLSTEFTRIENNYVTNYPNVDVNFMNTSNEFNAGEKSSSTHSIQDAIQSSDPPCMIMDFVPEWSYCEGGTKLLIIGPWYFQSEYAVMFDSYSVPASLVQAGVLRCYCPEHAVGLVSLQVLSAGSIISNSVVFEYKKRPHYDENVCHNSCNIKSEQCNQYTYENDTLLKFILIQRIESIQEDAYKHSSVPHINKYEALPEKAST